MSPRTRRQRVVSVSPPGSPRGLRSPRVTTVSRLSPRNRRSPARSKRSTSDKNKPSSSVLRGNRVPPVPSIPQRRRNNYTDQINGHSYSSYDEDIFSMSIPTTAHGSIPNTKGPVELDSSEDKEMKEVKEIFTKLRRAIDKNKHDKAKDIIKKAQENLDEHSKAAYIFRRVTDNVNSVWLESPDVETKDHKKEHKKTAIEILDRAITKDDYYDEYQ